MKGDTLYGIARAFNITLGELGAVNDPDVIDVIHDGDVLRLPSNARSLASTDVETVKYTVKQGDTIIKIAKANDVVPAQLLALNGKLATPDDLAVGEVLLIPQF